MLKVTNHYSILTEQLIPTGRERLLLGGDHSISVISIAALSPHLDFRHLGIIHFDSHADINSLKSSPTGNLHGIWLRSLIESHGRRSGHPIDILTKRFKPISPSNIVMIGNLELDHGEREFINQERIRTFGETNTSHHFSAKHPELVMAEIRNWMIEKRLEHLHTSFDIDVFNRKFVRATATPARNGMHPEQIFPILEYLVYITRRSGLSMSVDLAEYNPMIKVIKNDRSLEYGQKIISLVS